MTLIGVVADEPDVRDSYVFYKLDAKSLTLEDSDGVPLDVTGATRLSGPRYPVYDYGDRLQVSGDLKSPTVFEDFDYRGFLAHKGIHSQISFAEITWLSGSDGSAWRHKMLAFKGRAQSTIARILPEPEASLLTGILLGLEGGIPGDLNEDFKATGASHVIAISGFNISLVVGLVLATAGRILPDRRQAAGIAIVGVIAYTLLVGADAAVVRAALMGIVTLIGLLVGRPGLALNSLAFAVLLMTALNPFTLWDVGFQLSVAATLGLILYATRFAEMTQRALTRRFSTERAKQLVGWISEAVLLTVAAQILVTPLILKYFGRLSLVTLLTNLLILPIQPLVMAFGGGATLIGVVIEPLGRVVGWGAYPWLTWTIRVVEWTARFPYASIPFELSDLGLVAIYGVLGGLTWVVLMSRERRRELWQGMRAHASLKVALVGLALVTVVAWVAMLQLPDDRLHVAFLDVGQGDAIFITAPGGVQILVDGGPVGSALLAELGRRMPFWDHTLDLVVLTHPDADHLTGLISVLEHYEVRAVVVGASARGEQSDQAELLDAWETALAGEKATLVPGEAGTRMELSNGVTFDLLHPGSESVESQQDNANNASIVMRLVYGDAAFLLPGDIEAEAERELVRSGAYLISTVLKVPHHGGKTSSCQAFLEAVEPQVAVISVGQDNRFEHPSEEVLERLEGAQVYRTDRNGNVTVTTDGHTLWIETER